MHKCFFVHRLMESPTRASWGRLLIPTAVKLDGKYKTLTSRFGGFVENEKRANVWYSHSTMLKLPGCLSRVTATKHLVRLSAVASTSWVRLGELGRTIHQVSTRTRPGEETTLWQSTSCTISRSRRIKANTTGFLDDSCLPTCIVVNG